MRAGMTKDWIDKQGFAILEKGESIMGIGWTFNECIIDAKENMDRPDPSMDDVDFLNLRNIKEVDDGEICWTYIADDLSEHLQEHGYDCDYSYIENQTIIELPLWHNEGR